MHRPLLFFWRSSRIHDNSMMKNDVRKVTDTVLLRKTTCPESCSFWFYRQHRITISFPVTLFVANISTISIISLKRVVSLTRFEPKLSTACKFIEYPDTRLGLALGSFEALLAHLKVSIVCLLKSYDQNQKIFSVLFLLYVFRSNPIMRCFESTTKANCRKYHIERIYVVITQDLYIFSKLEKYENDASVERLFYLWGTRKGQLHELYAPLIILNCSAAPVAFRASSSCIRRFTSDSSCSWRRLRARRSLLSRFWTTAGTKGAHWSVCKNCCN